MQNLTRIDFFIGQLPFILSFGNRDLSKWQTLLYEFVTEIVLLWQGNDQVCQWLFDTYQTQDSALQLVVLRFLPILCGVYLPRVTTCPDEPLAGSFMK